jgi:hypothetical protein
MLNNYLRIGKVNTSGMPNVGLVVAISAESAACLHHRLYIREREDVSFEAKT